MNRKAIWGLAILALLVGAWWAWHSRGAPPPVVPAEQQAQQAIQTGVEAVGQAQQAVHSAQVIIHALPGEVTTIEAHAIDAARFADLDTLADRANSRIREWVRQHPAGDAVRSSDAGAGAVLSGDSGAGQ